MWNTFLYQPLVNALAFLISIIPGGDVGIAIILLTLLVKIILFPLSQKAIENQAAMKILTPEIERIKKSGASKEDQAKLTFELYKKHKANPFSGCLVQIPAIIVILALYRVFIKGVNFDNEILYSFVHLPAQVNMIFLGLIDISKKSVVLAVLAAITQYFQAYFMPKPAAPSPDSADSFQANLARSMSSNMMYGLPIFIFVLLGTNLLGISLTGGVALYFITSNLFAIAQQIYVSRHERGTLAHEAKAMIS